MRKNSYINKNIAYICRSKCRYVRNMKKLSRILEKIVTLGQGEKLLRLTTQHGDVKCVAAGDPAVPGIFVPKIKELPSQLIIDDSKIDISEYETFIVCGNSMLPQNIEDGSTLLVRKYPLPKYRKGDFLVIRVDPEYYRKFNPKTTVYDYKLRRALFRIEPKMDETELIRRLKENDYTVYIERMQEYAIRKYRNARKAYPDRELMLSTTYHDGELKYSFHPVDLIYGKADVLITDTKLVFLKAA